MAGSGGLWGFKSLTQEIQFSLLFFLPPLIITFDMCFFSYVNERDFYIVSIHRFEKELYSFLTVLDTDFRLLPSRVFQLTRVHYCLARFLRSFMLIEYYCLVNPCSSRLSQLGNYANLLRQNPWMVVKHIWVFSFSLLFLNDLPTLAFDLRMHWAQLSGKKIMFLSPEFKWLVNSFAMHGIWALHEQQSDAISCLKNPLSFHHILIRWMRNWPTLILLMEPDTVIYHIFHCKFIGRWTQLRSGVRILGSLTTWFWDKAMTTMMISGWIRTSLTESPVTRYHSKLVSDWYESLKIMMT